VQELSLVPQLRASIVPLAQHPNARVRSKAIGVLGELPDLPADIMLEKALNDADARVRANAIEVLEDKRNADFIPMLAERARSSHNRERANAIKALHKMKVGAAKGALLGMLRDGRGEHRISALWALRQIGLWDLLQEVGRIAREDTNLRVRRYALGVIRTLAELVEAQKAVQRRPQAKAG
jgi:HEAT repeat protein